MPESTAFQRALRDRHRPHHAERGAVEHAAFFLPHLRPGMALLDLGCGPGSITAGLAAAVAPGSTTGVDLEPGGPGGISFVTADVRDLPFPDASFDAIFAHALLQHLPDPLVALREARRVARPGAVIGVRDCDWDGQLLAPSDPLLDRSLQVMDRLRAGSSPRVGKNLRGLLAEAGFQDAEATASVLHEGTAQGARDTAAFHASFFTAPGIVDRVVGEAWATREELSEIGDAWLRWGEHPGAFLARFWCEVVAWA